VAPAARSARRADAAVVSRDHCECDITIAAARRNTRTLTPMCSLGGRAGQRPHLALVSGRDRRRAGIEGRYTLARIARASRHSMWWACLMAAIWRGTSRFSCARPGRQREAVGSAAFIERSLGAGVPTPSLTTASATAISDGARTLIGHGDGVDSMRSPTSTPGRSPFSSAYWRMRTPPSSPTYADVAP